MSQHINIMAGWTTMAEWEEVIKEREVEEIELREVQAGAWREEEVAWKEAEAEVFEMIIFFYTQTCRNSFLNY